MIKSLSFTVTVQLFYQYPDFLEAIWVVINQFLSQRVYFKWVLAILLCIQAPMWSTSSMTTSQWFTTQTPCGSFSSTIIGVVIVKGGEAALIFYCVLCLPVYCLYQIVLWRFAPIWKDLASDVKDWAPIVKIGAINCADQACDRYQVSWRDIDFLTKLALTQYLDWWNSDHKDFSSKHSDKSDGLFILWIWYTSQEWKGLLREDNSLQHCCRFLRRRKHKYQLSCQKVTWLFKSCSFITSFVLTIIAWMI